MIHGGAGVRAMTRAQQTTLSRVLVYGLTLLKEGYDSCFVVKAAIECLEDSGQFNAGRGGRVQSDGIRRLDASIMEGKKLQAGAVAGVEGVASPIGLACHIMKATPHVLMIGPHASRLGKQLGMGEKRGGESRLKSVEKMRAVSRELLGGLRLVPKAGFSKKQKAIEPKETVGAVALDSAGDLAAGASTGGYGTMLPGRVGDSALIGSGVYADNTGGAASMTGLGETIIRVGAAKEITDRLTAGASPVQAVRPVLTKLRRRVQGTAGVLVLGLDGRFAIRHTTPYMVAGYWNGKGKPIIRDQFR